MGSLQGTTLKKQFMNHAVTFRDNSMEESTTSITESEI